MTNFQAQLDWITTERDRMIELTQAWSRINSGSTNIEGLARMCAALKTEFAALGGEMREVELKPREIVSEKGEVKTAPLGKALVIEKRKDAKLQLYLGGHMDTVFAADHPFQTPEMLDAKRMRGPGVADLKGGLVVMLTALKALEKSEHAENLGWKIVINPDEEIGSPGSDALFAQVAPTVHLGLIFEPALPDGSMAGARKGSGNFTVIMRGKGAHAGRAIHEGRNAIVALSELIIELSKLNNLHDGLTLNPGKIEGGGPVNLVPDLAICRFNVRVQNAEQKAWLQTKLNDLVAQYGAREGYKCELHGGFTRPPKTITPANEKLFTLVQETAKFLGTTINFKATGGCCDGNNLAAYGVPNVDTMGVVGEHLHTVEEYMLVDSLVERAQLAASVMLKLASGEAAWAT